MSKQLILALISLGLLFPVQAQSLRQIHKQMKLIPPGSFEMGGGDQYEAEETNMVYLESDQLSVENATGKVTIGAVGDYPRDLNFVCQRNGNMLPKG